MEPTFASDPWDEILDTINRIKLEHARQGSGWVQNIVVHIATRDEWLDLIAAIPFPVANHTLDGSGAILFAGARIVPGWKHIIRT